MLATRLLSGLFASAALLATCGVFAHAQPQLRITPEAVTAHRTWDDQFIAVGKFHLECVAAAGQEALLWGIGFHDFGTGPWENVLELAIGLDDNGDGHWLPGDDVLHPQIPAFGQDQSGQPAQTEDWPFLEYYNGHSFRETYLGVSRADGNDDDIVFAAGEEQTWFLLYRVAADTPLDATWEPSLKPGIFGWTLAGPGSAQPFLPPTSGSLSVLGYTFDFDAQTVTEPSGTVWPMDESPVDPVAFLNTAFFPLHGYELRGLHIEALPTTPGQSLVPLASNAPMGAAQVAVLDGESHELDSLSLRLTSGDPAHIAALRLVLDGNENGVFDPGELVLGESAGLSLDGVTFDFSPFTLAGSDSLALLMLADTNGGVRVDMSYQLTVTDMGVTNGDPIGTPLLLPVYIGRPELAPMMNLGFDPASLVDREAEPVPEPVVAGVILIDAVDTPLTLTRVSLRAIGSVLPERDISGVILFADHNGNGLPDPIDPQLAMGTFDAAGQAVLPLAAVIPSGGRLRIGVAILFTQTVISGSTFGFRVDAATALEPVPVSGLGQPTAPVVLVRAVDADPEFDPVSEGPFEVPVGAAGCVTGTSGSLPWLVLVLSLLLTARRQRG